MPSVVGRWAHIVGAEPTWIYLPEEPDYSKHVEAREPESSSSHDPEGEESEEETAEAEEADEEEQRSPPAEESSERGRGRDPRKEPEKSVTSHKYGSSKKRSSSTSHSARKRKEPLRAATPAPTRSPKPLYLPPHRRELKAKSKPLSYYDPKTTRPAEPESSCPRARGSLRPPEPEQPSQERRGRSRSPIQSCKTTCGLKRQEWLFQKCMPFLSGFSKCLKLSHLRVGKPKGL